MTTPATPPADGGTGTPPPAAPSDESKGILKGLVKEAIQELIEENKADPARTERKPNFLNSILGYGS